MDTPVPEMGPVGRTVRRLRNDRGWALDEAAARLGISRRLLTQLESGSANPSLSTLLKVASGLDVALITLLSDDPQPKLNVRHASEPATELWRSERGGSARLLSSSETLELWEWRLAPGDTRQSNAHRRGARETIWVLHGTVGLTVGGHPTVSLSAGASAGYEADVDHCYANADAVETAVFVMGVFEPAGAGS